MANQHSILSRLRETDFDRVEVLGRLNVVERGERTSYERELEGHVRSLVEQLQTYEKALRWIERCAYDHHQQHTMFTHIQRRAMAVLNPAMRPDDA